MIWLDLADWYATPAEVFMLLGMMFVIGLYAVILTKKYVDMEAQLRRLLTKPEKTKSENKQSPKKTKPSLHSTG